MMHRLPDSKHQPSGRMSATETPVNSVAVTYPLGSQVNCTSSMPLSSSDSTSELLLDDGIGSMDSKDNSNEFKINLKETLNGLQSLNGQSQLMNDNLSSKEENLKESEIVLQDGNKNDNLNQHKLGSSLENTPKVINLLENSKSNAFSMNEKVRSSWDIVSKIQVNTPSLGNLLSKTKYIDCKDPNCKNLAEKNRIESEQAQQNGLSSNKSGGSGGNLFENIKDLKMDSANKMVEEIQKPEDDTAEPESKMTDSVEESEGQETQESVISDKEETSNSDDISDCDSKPSQNDVSSHNSLDSSPSGDEPTLEKTEDNDEEHIEKETIDDQEKHDCDINSSNQVQSNEDVKMDVDCDSSSVKMATEDTESRKKSDDELLEDSENNYKIEDKKLSDDLNNDEIEQEEEDKLLASDSENSESKNGGDGEETDCKMEVDSEEENEKEEEEEEEKKAKVSEESEEVKDSKDGLLLNKTEVKVEPVKEENIKKETTESDSNDTKIDIKQEEENSNSSESCERKRPADADESVSSQPKRSRLDFVIGKLGSQIGIKPELLPLEDDVSDTEDSTRPDSEESSKSDDASSCVSETETTEETEEEKSPRKKRKKPLRFTRKELKDLVKAKIQSYLKSEQLGIIQELQTKIDELQEANDKWKQKAKDLEKQMLDLTILQQKHEKRKAKTAALRQISTKNVAVQVDENKANLMSKLGQQPGTPQKPVSSKTPPKAGVTMASPPPTATQIIKSPTTPTSTIMITKTITSPALSSVPPKLTPMNISQVTVANNSVTRVIPTAPQAQFVTTSAPNQQTLRVGFPSNQTVKSLLDTNRQATGNTPKFVAQPPSTNFIVVTTAAPALVSSTGAGVKSNLSKTNSNIAQAIAVASNNQQLVQNSLQHTVKVIDLTGEEENAAKKGLLTQATAVPVLQQTGIRQPVFGQQVMRPVVPGQPGLNPGQGLLVSTPSGTLVRPGGQQAYQLVFNPTSPALRPGMLTVVQQQPPNSSTSVVRPVSSFIPTAVTTVPPQLKTGQLVPGSLVTSTVQKPVESTKSTVMTQVVRPPPPLQSAPVTKMDDINKKLLNTGNLLHPAMLPPPPIYHIKPYDKALPPMPTLNISRVSQGIVLSWNMSSNIGNHAGVASYQLFAYQEGSAPPSTSLWKKVGDVKALPLPMACTLTQFQEGNHYHFAIRAVDVTGRIGPFSKPSSIHLTKKD